MKKINLLFFTLAVSIVFFTIENSPLHAEEKPYTVRNRYLFCAVAVFSIPKNGIIEQGIKPGETKEIPADAFPIMFQSGQTDGCKLDPTQLDFKAGCYETYDNWGAWGADPRDC
jgi:hypothetical protein